MLLITIIFECKSNCDKRLSMKKYLEEIKPYLKDMNSLKNSGTWKIQLKIAIDFMFCKVCNAFKE